MDHWKSKADNSIDRCDFNGLPKSMEKAKNHCNGHQTIPYGYRNAVLNGSTFKYLLASKKSKTSLRLPALINLAWHKTLSVYGNGTITITATTGLNVKSPEFQLTPVIIDHSTYSEMKVGEILENIEADMRSTLQTNLRLGQAEMEKMENFCDSLIILWGENSSNLERTLPITLHIGEKDGKSFDIKISYNSYLFDEPLIDRVMGYFLNVVERLVGNTALTMSSLEFLPEKEKQLIELWNEETTEPFPEDKRLHHLVEEAASSTPDKLAVICKGSRVTYKELNEQGNQVGHYLHSKENVKVEQFIALFLDKTEVLLMTILGIWKSGAAHIPIDPQYPDERVKFILEDTKAKILIANEIYRDRLEKIFSGEQVKIMNVEQLIRFASLEPKHNLTHLPLRSDQLAYVTYTSGTTGIPKGVYKEHKGVVNSITDLSIRYEMVKETPEVVVLFSAYVWEPFIRQTFIALVNSQLLVIANDTEKLDQVKFLNFLNEHKVTYLNGTGSVLEEYKLEKCASLTKLILVGEELTQRRYNRFREKFNGKIMCEYGFTESALVSCLNIFNVGDRRIDRSIGKPLRNVKAYVVNSQLKRVPVGAIGELYIGGVGISRGYMNRDNLTKERFLGNPFQSKEEKLKGINNLMYKTGDLARWLPNGYIEYIGRNDFQVKLRGTRIEPGEIESVVLEYPEVKITKCTVTVKDSKCPEESTASSRHLVGYFVASQVILEEEIIGYLEKILPRYMIPVRMAQVPNIMTNINGKVDLKALPEVELTRNTLTPKHCSRNEVDSKLIQIWCDALGIPDGEIGIHDDFFRLGGHSITCIQLVAKIRQQFNCDITIDNIFALRNVEKLSDFIACNASDFSKNKEDQKNTQITGIADDQEFLANSLQQGLVYHYLKQGEDDGAYLMQSHYQYTGAINVKIYRSGWLLALVKFPSLRLNFKVKKEVFQVITRPESSSSFEFDWNFLDISNLSMSAKKQEVDTIINLDREKRYNLEQGPLFRIYLVKKSDSDYSMIFSYHHIIMDGWSLPILFGWVHDTYKRLLEKEEINPVPDLAYFHAQRYFEDHRSDHLDYWINEVEKVEHRVNLSGLLKPEVKYKVQLSNYDQIKEQKQLTEEISKELLKQLQEFGAHFGVTLHSILQFAWHKVLHTYGGGSHTVVGTTVSGRNIPVNGIEDSVGLFINTLPLVVDHKVEGQGSLTISQAIQEIQMKVNAMNSKSTVELGRLGGGGRNGELKHSLFDSLFVLEPEMDMGSFLGIRMVGDYEKLDYPLAVIAREEQGILKFTLCYAGELFEDHVIQDVLKLLEYFLEQIVRDSEKTVKNMGLVLPNQLSLMDGWNQTRKEFSNDKTLNQVFEACVLSNPTKTALVYENKKWSYDKLNQRANQLACHLRSLTRIKPDDKIALFLEKNDLLIITIFGVWKAGAAFVPIDPGYPDERIQFILQDTQAKLVVVNDINIDRLGDIIRSNEQTSIKIVNINKVVHDNVLSILNDTNLPTMSTSRDLCYVIYTSGTTGKPKGVMTEHLGVVNLHESLSSLFNLKSSSSPASKPEVFLSFSNFVFDHFVEQMTDALLSGQTLVVLNDDMRTDKQRLYKYIQDNHVTYLSGTPSVLSLYEYNELPTITRIDAVGEDFTPAYFNKIRATFPSGLIINGYGPTETSITTHKRLYTPGELRIDKSIGHQISNSTCYILSTENGNRVPIGAVGDLYLGGIGVGRGYLNREDLTQKAFVENPFVSEDDLKEGRNLRLYKTGDLARFLQNGEVECLGRNDFQVKVRGLRIELSEIESNILSFPGISQAVVVSQKRDLNCTVEEVSSFLVGYFVSNGKINEQALLTFLQQKLPSFMMPNRLVQVDSIPVTVNGKCDTNKLPKVQFIIRKDADSIDKLNEIEIKLRFIWSDLLRISVDQIGLQDDFFSLGGDSLLVTSMTFMINKSFGKVITIPQVFLHKTVKGLGQLISGSDYHGRLEIQQIEKGHFAPTSLAQERLLFIDEMEEGTSAFNVPFIFKLKLDAEISTVMDSLKLVAKRHEALRTLLVKMGDSHRQKIVSDEEFEELWLHSIKITDDTTGDSPMENLDLFENHVFKLDKELPLRITCINCSRDTFISVVFHHTCFDGWSMAIFQRDWLSFYNFLQDGHHGDANEISQLPKLDFHYKEFSLLQRNLLNSDKLNKLSTYWLNMLSNFDQLSLPTDYERPSKFCYLGQELFHHLNPEVTSALKLFAKSMKTSLFTVLASAFALTMSTYSGQEDVLIGAPISNRIRSEFENVIGFFINIIPLSFCVKQDLTLGDFLESVGDQLVTSQVNQDMPFEKLVKQLKIVKDLSRHPLFQVMLNFNPLAGPAAVDQVAPFELIDDEHRSLTLGKDTTAKYDLSVTITEERDGLIINFTYAKTLFSEITVQGYLNSFVHNLETFIQPENRGKRLQELDLVSNDRESLQSIKLEHQLFSNDYVGCSTLPQIFAKIVDKYEGEVALVFGDRQVTYDKLDAGANQVARLLHENILIQNTVEGRSPSRIFALVMGKSDIMITTILGIWKVGAAYAPIDPAYPNERIKFILKDTDTKVILCDETNESRLTQILGESDTKIKVVTINDNTLNGKCTSLPELDINLNASDENDLCYLVYTSGSTGIPKGVMITHKNVLSFRSSLLRHHFKSQSVLLLSNIVFDFSIEQLILSIFNCGKLIIPENDFVINDQFYNNLNHQKLAYLSGTPSVITALDLSRLTHLKTVTVAGEMFTKAHFNTIRSSFSGRLINAYGVTETTVYNSVSIFGENDNLYKNSLGEFFPNTEYHLLDSYLRHLPQGAVAELYLSGACVSPGYLNREEMKRKHFVANPYSSDDHCCKDNSVLYRTGDLVRLKPCGELEYLRRNDNQIKIRGFRVELQEIVNTLMKHDGVKQCVVFCEGNKLVGVFTIKSELKSVDGVDDLSLFLERVLPQHMIPVLIQYKGESLPVTRNGKLDISELRNLYKSKYCCSSTAPLKPKNMAEKTLCKIFSSVLDIPEKEFGVSDDFFRLGGDSISSLLVVGKIQNQLGVKCNVKQIFDYRTIQKLADMLCGSTVSKSLNDSQKLVNGHTEGPTTGRPTGIVPLLPIQKWFFAKTNLSTPHHFNQTFAISVPPLDIQRLKNSLQVLVNHHDAFRLRFHLTTTATSQGCIQCYQDDGDETTMKVNFHQFDITALDQVEIECQLDKWSSSIDIQKGPLYAVAYLEDKLNNKFKLWWTIHHLIVDTVSWRIIKDDLQTLYEGQDNLGEKGMSYKEFSLLLKSNQFSNERPYWENIVKKIPLYNAKIIGKNETDKPSNFNFVLDSLKTKRLIDGVQRSTCGTTIQDYLLTGVAYGLEKLTNCSTNYVTLEGHGRQESQLCNTIGWFTTMYPVELQVDVKCDLQYNREKIEESLRSIPNKGTGYGTIFGYVDPPMPCVTFNYLGAFGGTNNLAWDLCDLGLELRCGSKKDKRTSDSVIDITAVCDKGRLRFSIDTSLKPEAGQEFVQTLQQTLEEICNNFEVETIEELPSFGKDYEAYFEFPSETDMNSTLFILPPGEGGAESYFNNLVPHLKKQFKLVVFNNYYFDKCSLDTTFQELALQYLKYVRDIQANGPYNLLGWSFGGVLALEMSKQLQLANSGAHVENLFLIDSYFNVGKAVKDLNLLKGLDIIDKINHKYTPNPADFEQIRNIILFKATERNDIAKTKEQELLYEYFRHSCFNNLDTWVSSEFITVEEMEAHSHVSWTGDEKQVTRISDIVKGKILDAKM